MREPLTIDLGTPVRPADIPALFGKFMTWWGDELRELLPASGAKPVSRQQTYLYMRRDRWFLKSAASADAVTLDTTLGDAELANQILNAANDMPLSRLTVMLPREHVIVRRVDLPQMSPSHMRQAVELQIDRLSPFKLDAVRYAVKAVGRDAEQGTVHTDVAIVPHIRVRPVEQRLQSLGIKPLAVDVEGEGGAPSGFDLTEPPGPDELRRRRTLNWGLAAGAALLWVLAIYAWNQSGASEVEAWEQHVATLEPAASRAASLRRQIEGLGAPVAEANAHDPAEMLDILRELTRVLPDTTRVVELRIDRGTIVFSGLGTDVQKLIGLLEASNKFQGVKFTLPIVRKEGSTIDRFEIAMQIEKGKVS